MKRIDLLRVGVVLVLTLTTIGYVCGDEYYCGNIVGGNPGRVHGIIQVCPYPVILRAGVQNNVSISCVAGERHCDSGFFRMDIGVTLSTGKVANIASVDRGNKIPVYYQDRHDFMESNVTGLTASDCTPVLKITGVSLQDLFLKWTCTLQYVVRNIHTCFDVASFALIPYPETTLFITPEKESYQITDVVRLNCTANMYVKDRPETALSVTFQYKCENNTWRNISADDRTQALGVTTGPAERDGDFYKRTTTLKLLMSSIPGCRGRLRCLLWFGSIAFEDAAPEVEINVFPDDDDTAQTKKQLALLLGGSIGGSLVFFIIIVSIVVVIQSRRRQHTPSPPPTTLPTQGLDVSEVNTEQSQSDYDDTSSACESQSSGNETAS